MKLIDLEKVSSLKILLDNCMGALTHIEHGGTRSFKVVDEFKKWCASIPTEEARTLYQSKKEEILKELAALGVTVPEQKE